MLNRTLILTLLILAVFCGQSYAIDSNDLLIMKQAGVDEKVIVNKAVKDGLDTKLSVTDLLKLNAAGFSPTSLQTLIDLEPNSTATSTQSPEQNSQPTPKAQVAATPKETSPKQVMTNTLNIINRSQQKLHISVDQASYSIKVSTRKMKNSSLLHPNQGLSYTLDTSHYWLNHADGTKSFDLDLTAESAELNLSNDSTYQSFMLNFTFTQQNDSSTGTLLQRPRTVVRAAPVVIVNRLYCGSCSVYYTGSHIHSANTASMVIVSKLYCNSCSVYYTDSHIHSANTASVVIVSKRYCNSCSNYYTGNHKHPAQVIVTKHYCKSCKIYYTGSHRHSNNRRQCNSCNSYYTGSHRCAKNKHVSIVINKSRCVSCNTYYTGSHRCTNSSRSSYSYYSSNGRHNSGVSLVSVLLNGKSHKKKYTRKSRRQKKQNKKHCN